MTEVIVAPQARDDLLRIVTHLAEVASPTTARKWNDRLWQTIDGLGEFPGTGPRRSKLGANVRIAIVTPYLVIYEHELNSRVVHVLRVIHGKRRITRRLLRGAI